MEVQVAQEAVASLAVNESFENYQIILRAFEPDHSRCKGNVWYGRCGFIREFRL